MSNGLLGFHAQSVLSQCQWGEAPQTQGLARIYFFGAKEKVNFKDNDLIPFEWQKPKDKNWPLIHKFASADGPVWVIKMHLPTNSAHHGQFQISGFAAARDTLGTVWREASTSEVVQIKYFGKDAEEFSGMMVGVEMAQYRFRNYWPEKPADKKHEGKKLYVEAKGLGSGKNIQAKKLLTSAKSLGEAVNVSRHLVNLPPNILNPKTYAQFCRELFKNSKCKVDVWNDEQLKKEKHFLHVAVGQASEDPSCLVKISYRGSVSGPSQKKHYAFVGKGITFDSGGLDLKPAAGMREMKKDMGGSASVVALAYWMSQTKPKINVDFYLAIAENSVSDEAFRPGDVYQTRAGKTVEIHNTDAEGRLVLCDTLGLACESKPEWVMDLATLTGAIKVALGETTPGLFCNNDKLAKSILAAAQQTGDNCWRMPLDPSQKNKLRSDVADLANAHEGFGGAVTAALFLEAFVGTTPWAHFDIYAWTGSANGALSEKGGNGQLVQCLANLCEQL